MHFYRNTSTNMAHIFLQSYHFNISLIFLANGTKEADGDGTGDKTDAQGNNSTTKVYYHSSPKCKMVIYYAEYII